MTELPYMSIATDSFIVDTGHMSAEQFGAYVRICVALWRHGGELNGDDAQLARIAGVSMARWKKIAPTVTAGMPRPNGKISDDNIVENMRKARERSAKAKEAARSRWDRPNHLKSLRSIDANAVAEHLPKNTR
jgi:uncharacterized protein YdaU (DUF1376 family)